MKLSFKNKKEAIFKISMTAVFFILFVVFAVLTLTDVLAATESDFYARLTRRPNDLTITFFKVMTEFGSTIVLSSLCIILLALPKTFKKIGLPVAVTAVVSVVFNNIFKVIFRRARPDIVLWLVEEKWFSFPSGHAQNSAAIFVMIMLCVLMHVKNKWIKAGLSVVCVALLLLIALSRVYLGVHYLGDVLCGIFLGAFIAFAVDIAFKIRWKHFFKKS